jgi:hypothetical protein
MCQDPMVELGARLDFEGPARTICAPLADCCTPLQTTVDHRKPELRESFGGVSQEAQSPFPATLQEPCPALRNAVRRAKARFRGV